MQILHQIISGGKTLSDGANQNLHMRYSIILSELDRDKRCELDAVSEDFGELTTTECLWRILGQNDQAAKDVVDLSKNNADQITLRAFA